jgi:hypothetical protein
MRLRPTCAAAILKKSALGSCVTKKTKGFATRLLERQLVNVPAPPDVAARLEEAGRLNVATKLKRREAHFRDLCVERLGVLEVLIRILPAEQAWVKALRQDIRGYMAESDLMLDLTADPPLVVPMDEPLLQSEVIDKMLPRLHAAGYGKEADKLVKAYHDHLNGVDSNKVFGDAFKALEAVAKGISGNEKLMLSKDQDVQKYFPELHGTIRKTISNLAAHRGDEGGHGGKGPDAYEMRYLLFSICNLALLMLDYPTPS